MFLLNLYFYVVKPLYWDQVKIKNLSNLKLVVGVSHDKVPYLVSYQLFHERPLLGRPSINYETAMISGNALKLTPHMHMLHYCASLIPVSHDQGVRGTVVYERRLLLATEFSDNTLGQYLPKLNPPLVEGIDLPYDSLSKDAVFVECN